VPRKINTPEQIINKDHVHRIVLKRDVSSVILDHVRSCGMNWSEPLRLDTLS
jgi:hypothetical protein